MNILTATEILKGVGSIVLAVLILLVMITVHEFGHYIAGKILNFKINEFAIGFGPKIFSRKSKKTGEVFSVRIFPLGGFCGFEGEDGNDVDEQGNPVPTSENAFTKKAPWKRIIVLIAGATMNYLLALLFIIVSFSAIGQTVYKVNSINEEVNSEYCLVAGDKILDVDGEGVYIVTDLLNALRGKNAGEHVFVSVENDGDVFKREVELFSNCDFDGSNTDNSKMWKALGVGTVERDGINYWDLSVSAHRFGFFATIGHSFVYSGKIGGTIFRALGDLVTGKLSLDSFGGPVTTIKMTSEIASQSLQSFLEIAAYIGVNLAIFNLLPIPALDGSKVVFCLIEWIFRKPIPRKIEAVIHMAGFVLILGFAVLVDVLQFANCRF